MREAEGSRGALHSHGMWWRHAAQDYTLFEPANTAYTLSDATKWQPLVIEPVPPYSGGGATALTGAP